MRIKIEEKRKREPEIRSRSSSYGKYLDFFLVDEGKESLLFSSRGLSVQEINIKKKQALDVYQSQEATRLSL